MISKIIFPLVLSTFIEQNIFFPDTYNAFTIFEPDFTVWIQHIENFFKDFDLYAKISLILDTPV